MKGKNHKTHRSIPIEQFERRILLSGYAFSSLGSFDRDAGVGPQAGVTFDSKGDVFGTTEGGGNSGLGAVFEIPAGSTTPVNIVSFTQSVGTHPFASVTFDSKGNLFGTTAAGGDANGDGTVYEIAGGTGVYSTVAAFNGTNGSNPHAAVVFDSSGNLFGTTISGGDSSGDGTVFEIAAGSKTITTVAQFNGANGSQPYGGLVLDSSGNLFGTTNAGGSSGEGTAFEIAKGSHSITTIANFTGLGGPGPMAGLTIDASGNLFGTTIAGGAAGRGEVFEIAHGSKTIKQLAGFNVTNGADPVDAVTLDSSGDIFGTTLDGTGTSANGTIFEIVKGTTTIKTLASFNDASGKFSHASVTFDKSGNLFGTAGLGGSSGNGTVFELGKGATTIKTVASFKTNGGDNPHGRVALDAQGNLFGVTAAGGTSNDGTVFEIKSGTSSITTIASFNGANGSSPYGGVTFDAHGNLFGTTSYGGAANDGTVFEIKSGSSAITTVASFNGTNGAHSLAAVIFDSAGNLFGTAPSGGANNFGTVFEIKSGTTSIVTVSPFTASGARNPEAPVTLDSSGNLFGTTPNSSTGSGAVYEVKKGSSSITTVNIFTGANNGGESPRAGVTFDTSGNLFGTTEYGGTQNDGTVFEIKKGTSSAITVATFNGANGEFPLTPILFDSNGNLFGTTEESAAFFGTVYQIPKGSSIITVVANFTGANHGGTDPDSGLAIDAGGNLFGTTAVGGNDFNGAVFKLSPTITVSAPAAQSATPGIARTFSLGSFTETGIIGTFSVDVHWGDGSADTIFSQTAAGTISAKSHTFAKAGAYTVSLTIKDMHGHSSNTATFKVTV